LTSPKFGEEPKPLFAQGDVPSSLD